MLPTFVIGLREGLEAALIVGIIAAFLRQNGKTREMRSMWLVVALAIGICLAIGIGLRLTEQALAQKAQEGLETAIGLVAVSALVVMALLAVLREGLETAVFMLAAFDAADSPLAAGIGAVPGVVVAAAIGWGIYRGGVRVNLSRFFKITVRSPAPS